MFSNRMRCNLTNKAKPMTTQNVIRNTNWYLQQKITIKTLFASTI